MSLALETNALAGEAEVRRFRRVTLVWMGTMIVLFPLLIALGYYMRMFQANMFPTVRPEWFYAVLTLHGIGMVGNWFIGGMAAASYLLARYTRPSIRVSWFAYIGTLVGLGLLIASTLGGLFGAGWYFLYPLPMYSQGTWPAWATGCFFASLAVLGVVWMIWSLDVMRAIVKRYGFGRSLAWHYLKGGKEPEVPPLALITMVALIPAVACFIDAVVLLVLYAAQWQIKGFVDNALLMKNLTFFFGHIIANITMYLGVAVVYDMLPTFTKGRTWKTNRIVSLSWNSVLVMVFLAYFHHLYMDFAQPLMAQQMGQMMSYFSSIPAAVVSIFGGLALVYCARMRWTLGSLLMFLGLMGWAIGGVGAVIDSTVALNFRFHNTLWVPAHFHTYYLMGVVLMLLGFTSELGVDLTGIPESKLARRMILWLFLIGGYGFLMMFFWAGAHSIPRRYAVYPALLGSGATDAHIAVAFISLFLIGVLYFLWETGRRCVRAYFT
jgi:cytochrome c oxidase subunit 1